MVLEHLSGVPSAQGRTHLILLSSAHTHTEHGLVTYSEFHMND